MYFDEERLRKGIRYGLGSQGIWTPDLEDTMFREIRLKVLHQPPVIGMCRLIYDELKLKH